MSRRLIEEWLPIAEIGLESVRERTPMTPFPAPNRLHVWWARRPLVAARAAVLGSLLPGDADHGKFLHALGIHGDPVAAREKMDKARRTGKRVADPYGYARAFSYSPSSEDKKWIASEAERLGVHSPRVLDPTAGGGSIPFETLRLGFNAMSNDLNPVAALVEKLTAEIPLVMGTSVWSAFSSLARQWRARMEAELSSLFPQPRTKDLLDTTYLFARTIRCPYCGGLVPLSPNWRLGPDGTGVKLLPQTGSGEKDRYCRFEIVKSAAEQSAETVKGGRARCPYPDCGRVILGEEIKKQARSGKMGEQLYAVVYKQRRQTFRKDGTPGREKWERGYRAPRPEDDVFDLVQQKLAEKLPYWEALDMVPTEAIPDGLKTTEPLRYGMSLWRDMFSPRQLYCHCTSVQVFRELLDEAKSRPDFDETHRAAFAYLALAIDTLLNYGTRSCRWDNTTSRVRSLFDRHDFAFIASYAEMAPLVVGMGYDWAIEKTAKCLEELVGLLHPEIAATGTKKGRMQATLLEPAAGEGKLPEVHVGCGSADNLSGIADHGIDVVVMDPPYYDNVMYAELSDFFYVWLKRTAGYVYPELFVRTLTDKDEEAVANPARFRGDPRFRGKKLARHLAYVDYRQRMARIFGECLRVLKQDGVLLLMFNHKATGAWDALTRGLLDAGFMITASWPVKTEAEGSLHIRGKAAVNSTIFLVCRPRPTDRKEIVFWEDLEPLVTRKVLDRVGSFREAGIGGIDLYLACFGPALEVFSRYWPVRRGTPRPLGKKQGEDDPYATTPDDVLDTARSAVKDWSMKRILHADRQTDLDNLLSWYVLAWHVFRVPRFPYDEALQLARVAGLDMDREVIGVIAGKQTGDVILWDSATRAAKSSLGPADGSRSMLDVLHRAAHLARSRSLDRARDYLENLGLDSDPVFLASLSALLEVLPVSRSFGGSDPGKDLEAAADDFDALEHLRRLALSDRTRRPWQLSLLDLQKDG